MGYIDEASADLDHPSYRLGMTCCGHWQDATESKNAKIRQEDRARVGKPAIGWRLQIGSRAITSRPTRSKKESGHWFLSWNDGLRSSQHAEVKR